MSTYDATRERETPAHKAHRDSGPPYKGNFGLTLRAADPSIGPNTVRADRESLAYARRAFGAVPVQKLTPAALAAGRPR